MSAAAERVSYRWDQWLEEWFVNDGRGLEQGFTLQQRPAGGGGRLVLHLGVRGGLQARVGSDGQAVSFGDSARRAAVRYAGLRVRDAGGRDLAARFEGAGKELRLEVEETGAHYPLTIDPLAQQAYLKASNTGDGDEFGHAVAVSGDTVVVGAFFESSAATGSTATRATTALLPPARLTCSCGILGCGVSRLT